MMDNPLELPPQHKLPTNTRELRKTKKGHKKNSCARFFRTADPMVIAGGTAVACKWRRRRGAGPSWAELRDSPRAGSLLGGERGGDVGHLGGAARPGAA